MTLGSADAKVKVVFYSNFQSPTDKAAFATILEPMLKDYGDKVQVAFKNYVPSTATQATAASMAAACANEQGKFLAYGDKLFANQAVWSKAKDATMLLKSYAFGTGLNAADFGKCVDSKKYQDLITATFADGQSFGIAQSPSIFVGSDLQAPAVKYDDIKKALDAQLAQ